RVVNSKPGVLPKTDLDTGYLWLLAGLIFYAAAIGFFYLAFRSEKSIKRIPEFLRCKKCRKVYNYTDVKDKNNICPKCGGVLQDYAEFEKEQTEIKNKKYEQIEKLHEKIKLQDKKK
ncbi:MAG: endonuclease Q family protein, partial [Campylobacter sp.]|nr:endonuclease Q family protein [Campylobacter sp.]